MAKPKTYQIVIAEPARIRYENIVLPYLLENFTFDRAMEIDQGIVKKVSSLKQNPDRGTKEKYLSNLSEIFRFILYKETRIFELKIIYFTDKLAQTVFVTDFFPTKMNPVKIRGKQQFR